MTRESPQKPENMYDDPAIFKARALEEIRRARRYPSFVSLIQLDISHINSEREIENFDNIEKFHENLLDLVGRSVRDTDLISNHGTGRITLLLIETPREGARTLLERLKKTIRYFLCNNTKSPVNWRVPSRECYFPGSKDNGDDFLATIEDYDS
jgi:hypothetical protein